MKQKGEETLASYAFPCSAAARLGLIIVCSSSVNAYVCMYVCMYACMYADIMCVCVCVCVCACVLRRRKEELGTHTEEHTMTPSAAARHTH